MIKQMYLIRGESKENYPDFKSRVMSLVEEAAMRSDVQTLRVVLTEEAPPAISIIPFKKNKIAVISLYKENHALVDFLVTTPGYAGGFIVEEALPVAHDRIWQIGEPTPGACLLTLFHKKPGIDYETFINRWHNSHTPLSLKIHPLFSYNRNVVKEKLTDHPAWYDGIVEEQTQTLSELLNPFKFFGKPHQVIQNMLAVYKDTRSFIDYRRIETYLTVEYQMD